jgi:peptide/nickel transport system permease protein
MDKGAPIARFWAEFHDNRVAVAALALLVAVALLAVLAPLITPQDPYDLGRLVLSDARRPPGHIVSGGYIHWLGTDAQGRDLGIDQGNYERMIGQRSENEEALTKNVGSSNLGRRAQFEKDVLPMLKQVTANSLRASLKSAGVGDEETLKISERIVRGVIGCIVRGVVGRGGSIVVGGRRRAVVGRPVVLVVASGDEQPSVHVQDMEQAIDTHVPSVSGARAGRNPSFRNAGINGR